MTKKRALTAILAIFTFFLSLAFAASISGTIYDETIKPIDGAIIRLEKDAALYSQTIARNGVYSFQNLPQGDYRLIATVKINNKTLSTAARINLSAEDDLHIDLVLMEELGATLPELIEIPSEEFPTPIEEAPINWVLIGFLIGTIIIVLVIMLMLIRKIKAEKEEKEEKERETKLEYPEKYLTDEEKVYQIIQRRKEIPQKEIVAKTGFSKAKVTSILKKLEQKGKIKRKSVGREKIVNFI